VHLVWGRLPIVVSAGMHLPGAHHPHCDRYNHHLLWVQGRPLCLGCTCMALGAAIGMATILVPWGTAGTGIWIVGHLLGIAPAAAQPWFQKKWFKIGSRLMLGATAVSYWASGLFLLTPPASGFLWTVLMLVAFGTGYGLLWWLREAHANSPCTTCPLGMFPTCDWNLPRLLREPEFRAIRLSD
jgi:hypothetical protein